jgi:hypothetical protein
MVHSGAAAPLLLRLQIVGELHVPRHRVLRRLIRFVEVNEE